MADMKSDQERSRNMAAVKSRNTTPELLLRKAVWRRGMRFFTPSGWKRLTGTRPPGSPDLIFPRARLAVFVDGCFWHGCPEHYTAPDDNRDFWHGKLEKNMRRDQIVNAALAAAGWRVLRFWEHELKRGGIDLVADTIAAALAETVGTAHSFSPAPPPIPGEDDSDGGEFP